MGAFEPHLQSNAPSLPPTPNLAPLAFGLQVAGRAVPQIALVCTRVLALGRPTDSSHCELRTVSQCRWGVLKHRVAVGHVRLSGIAHYRCTLWAVDSVNEVGNQILIPE